MHQRAQHRSPIQLRPMSYESRRSLGLAVMVLGVLTAIAAVGVLSAAESGTWLQVVGVLLVIAAPVKWFAGRRLTRY